MSSQRGRLIRKLRSNSPNDQETETLRNKLGYSIYFKEKEENGRQSFHFPVVVYHK